MCRLIGGPRNAGKKPYLEKEALKRHKAKRAEGGTSGAEKGGCRWGKIWSGGFIPFRLKKVVLLFAEKIFAGRVGGGEGQSMTIRWGKACEVEGKGRG